MKKIYGLSLVLILSTLLGASAVRASDAVAIPVNIVVPAVLTGADAQTFGFTYTGPLSEARKYLTVHSQDAAWNSHHTICERIDRDHFHIQPGTPAQIKQFHVGDTHCGNETIELPGLSKDVQLKCETEVSAYCIFPAN